MKALDYVINYMYQDELKSYAELLDELGIEGDPEELAKARNDNHVFCALVRLKKDPDAEFLTSALVIEALNNYMAATRGPVNFTPSGPDTYEADLDNPIAPLVRMMKLRALVHNGYVDLRLLLPNTEVLLATFKLEDYLP